jgi:hypothetical protein
LTKNFCPNCGKRKKSKKSKFCKDCFIITGGKEAWAKAISDARMGHKHSEETKKKIGIKSANRPKEVLEKISKTLKGQVIPQEVRDKISKNNAKYWLGKKRPDITGANNTQWNGGPKTEYERIRKSLEYKLWRKAVFERDNYTCIWCGDNKGGNLEADHIKPFIFFPELRLAIDNGRTLCKQCHKKTDTYGSKVFKFKVL